MFLITDVHDQVKKFEKLEGLIEYIEFRHAEEGGFDWISEIIDDKGNHYGCTWSVKIEPID
ncbi:MAG: hypothetical protein A4E71_00057 [Smithella sp. PtaU1.Bin162]|nr:MAG: hypothetical protein A4E71_00057 [Smithella sp. PtaU1.Bin162]